MSRGLDAREIESVVRAVAARLGAAAESAPPSPNPAAAPSGLEVLVLCGAWASSADVVRAVKGNSYSVFDPRGRRFEGARHVVSELPDDPAVWAVGFNRAILCSPDLGLLEAVARFDCSEPVAGLALTLLGLGLPVEVPAVSANPLLRSFQGGLAEEASRLMSKLGSLGFCDGDVIDYREKKLVTVADVEAIPNGAALRLGKRSLVTPAAADALGEHGVTVIRGGLPS